MSGYDVIKTLHVLSATLIFGTGLGTAFYMWRGHLAGDLRALAVIARNVVLADAIFTAPAIAFQLASGAWLIWSGGYDPLEPWLLWAYGLFLLAGACWLPVVWLQIKVRDLVATAAADGTALPARYHRFMGHWFRLGWPAFLAVVVIFYLMVAKP